jgi:hypothetical protein
VRTAVDSLERRPPRTAARRSVNRKHAKATASSGRGRKGGDL